MQEGLVRPPRDWQPDVAPAESLRAAASRTLDVIQGAARAAAAAAAEGDSTNVRAKL